MKKNFLAILAVCLLLAGCQKISKQDVITTEAEDISVKFNQVNSEERNNPDLKEFDMSNLKHGRYKLKSEVPQHVKILLGTSNYVQPFELDKNGFITYLEDGMTIQVENGDYFSLEYLGEDITYKYDNVRNGDFYPGLYYEDKEEFPYGRYILKNNSEEPSIIYHGTYGSVTRDIIGPNSYKQVEIYGKDRIQVDTKDSVQVRRMPDRNSTERLFLPTAYGNIDVIHPSVVKLKKPINGYAYWLAGTPFYKSNAAEENPHIYASKDGIQWEVPQGLTNPIDDKPGKKEDLSRYNSDTHLIYDDSSETLLCFYREYDGSKDNKANIIYRESKDGVNWSDETIIYNGPQVLSPAIIKEDNKYRMYFVNEKYQVIEIESTDRMKQWTEERIIETIYSEGNLHNWHLDAQKENDGKYGLLISSFLADENRQAMDVGSTTPNRQTMSLYYAQSEDGYEFSEFKKVLTPRPDSSHWDNRGLYRSCYIMDGDKYIVYYTGFSTTGRKGTGISYGENMDDLQGLDSSHLDDFYK